MIRKSDLSLRIGMTMLVLCAALILTALPAAANYTGDHNLTEKDSGTVTGGMDYTIGNSTYSSKIWNNNSNTGAIDHYNVELTPDLPEGATNVSARLYVYWTWSYINDLNTMYNEGTEAEMDVNFDDQYTYEFDNPADYDSYVDWKDQSQQHTHNVYYNYPSGTYAYNVTDYVDATDADRTYYVNISNSRAYVYNPLTAGNDSHSFCIQAVGLLVLYNLEGSTATKYYWIDEGCDVTYLKALNFTAPINWRNNISPSVAKTWAPFTNVPTGISSATLITAAPSAGTPYNTLFVNNQEFDTGVWDGSPRDKDFSYNTTNILANLTSGNNSITFMNGLDDNDYRNDTQMGAANAFLLVNKTT
ncbi:cell surface glycoprotein [Methanosarcina barkeri str. Wiesmoor]|uniref:Cell surface glycoprotein n=2 Tax=Methanosarcina barkeri TaxID=2208 RepID=A0A0E3LLF8_METBA|nr:DUF3344 domain-containing protein [Methanosarcina barkeri]AKB51196.1 cell surface glycoprotein [Methanosarcina barkeri str. Wiesmoor]